MGSSQGGPIPRFPQKSRPCLLAGPLQTIATNPQEPELMCPVRNPIYCLIPPYMLQRIAERGPERLRVMAAELLTRSEHYRRQRTHVQLQIASRVFSRSALPTAPTAQPLRRVFDARGDEILPGTLVRAEGDPPTGDTAADEAYDGAGQTWRLFYDVYGRNSLDDGGLGLDSTVHYGRLFANALWDGRQMVYGDGDGEVFDRFTADPDIIGHELTHGVIQFTANLAYEYQSGALNESFADVFGCLVKQHARGQDAAEADWLIGENVLIGGQYAMRSMKAPGTGYQNHPILGDDPQPATMDDYQDLPIWDDRGGVHINSGIPNHAFYLAAVEIGGRAWEKAGRVWYRTLVEKLPRNPTFVQAASATIQAARELFGSGSLEQQAIEKAWKTVKVL